MATGEGKTLTAALAAVLAGWSGRPCHIITVNDYTRAHDFADACIVLDQMGEADQPFKVIAGDAHGATYLDCDLVVKLHQQSIAS